MSQATRFEVQTYTICGEWVNCWHDDDESQYFDTADEAQAAIYEFFANLSRAGMSQHYDLEDYRVVPTD